MNDDLKSTDIDWLAVQYLTGDLPADAVAHFESRLAHDQPAREALARAVELALAVSVVESTPRDVTLRDATPRDATCSPSGRTPAAWTVPAAWLAVAALALVAFVAFWNPPTPLSTWNRGDQSVTVNDLPASNSGELATLWVSTSELLVTTELEFDSESFDGLFDEELLDPLGESTVEGDMDIQRLQAPSWMMAALAGSADAEMQE